VTRGIQIKRLFTSSIIAKGSAAELSAQLEIAADIGKINASDPGKSIEACDEIGRMLRALIVARSKKKAG